MSRSLVPPPRPPDWWRLAHDPAAIARRSAALARRCGLRRHRLGVSDGEAVDLFESAPRPGERPRVYLSAAIHGDEPAGAEGLLRWWDAAGEAVFERFDFTIVPCLNPGGLRRNLRGDAAGRDLNRCMNRKGFSVLDALKTRLQQGRPFALSLHLHEDYDGCGVYVYELAERGLPIWSPALLRAVARFCPADSRKRIDGRVSRQGVMLPKVETPPLRAFFRRMGMAEAPWMFLEGRTARAYTVETPSEFDLSVRAETHKAFIEATLRKLR